MSATTTTPAGITNVRIADGLSSYRHNADGTVTVVRHGRALNTFRTLESAQAFAEQTWWVWGITTADLKPGQRVRVQFDTDARGIMLPFTPENPGAVVTVTTVEPWILTAGPRAGQQATSGRDRKPLTRVAFDNGREFATTAGQTWRAA